MTIDVSAEQKWNRVRENVTFKKISTGEFKKEWKEVFGDGEKTIKREKFVHREAEEGFVISDYFVLNQAALTEEEGLLVLEGKNSVGKKISIEMGKLDSKVTFGIQEQEGGEKSLVTMVSRIDRDTGKEEQTIRRFTEIKEIEVADLKFNEWVERSPVEISSIFRQLIPKGSTVLMEKLKLREGIFTEDTPPTEIGNFKTLFWEEAGFNFFGDRNGEPIHGHVRKPREVMVQKDENGNTAIAWKRGGENDVGEAKVRRFTAAKTQTLSGRV